MYEYEGLKDLKLERTSGNISFIHLTCPEYLNSIYTSGLKKSSGETTNFGIDVIYVADKFDIDSIEALAELSEDFTYNAENNEFAILHGSYNGEYIKCIGADEDGIFDYNIGFVGLLNEDKACILKHDIVKGNITKEYILNQYMN